MAASFALVFLVMQVGAQPIGVHSDNPHYFLFHGKPTVLITSAEHYGAVVNKAFDYNAYLDTLKAYGLIMSYSVTTPTVALRNQFHWIDQFFPFA